MINLRELFLFWCTEFCFLLNTGALAEYIHWCEKLEKGTSHSPFCSPTPSAWWQDQDTHLWSVDYRKGNSKGNSIRCAPVFGTSENYRKAHGSLLSGWMNYNYTACCWFPTPSNILILLSQFWQIRFESYWLHCSKCRILVLLWYYTERQKKHHFFRATLSKIHTIKINNIWTQISFNTP